MARANEMLIKTPYDECYVEINLTSAAPPGVSSISSGTVAAYEYDLSAPDTKTLVSSTFLSSTDITVVDLTKAWVGVKGGTAGKRYILDLKVVWNDGQKTENAAYLAVESYI